MKVIVRYAETGQELELTINEDKAIEEIQESLYSSIGVQPEFQILLSEDGISLKDKKCIPQFNTFIYAEYLHTIICELHICCEISCRRN